jgi:hypothetical protein
VHKRAPKGTVLQTQLTSKLTIKSRSSLRLLVRYEPLLSKSLSFSDLVRSIFASTVPLTNRA